MLNKTFQRKMCCLIATLLLAFFLPFDTNGAPGDLDPTFGNGGVVVTPITDGANLYEAPYAIKVQPDGKIVVCGMVRYINDEDSYEVSTFLARYNPNGTLDATFGVGGKVIWNGNTFVGESIALQRDGKIVAVGYGGGGFAVHRYNLDGAFDASFGAGGIVVTPVGLGGAWARDVAVQPDGKIIVIGQAFENDYDFAVVRYNPDGSLDNSLGAGGTVITALRNGNTFDEASSVVLQPDGKIVVFGTSIISGSPYDFALVRYNANGSLDSGFGVDGKIIHRIFNVNNHGLAVALQPDGKIVAAGGKYGEGPTAIVRYNANGSIDTSFATNGIFSTERGFFVGHDIGLQRDGKIVAFGNSSSDNAGFQGFAVARLNPNGSPDASFGLNGRLIAPVGRQSRAVAGALQPDGNILAFGETSTDGDIQIALVRYLGDVAPSCPNPIDCPDVLVRQHYLDFLDREPDAPGLDYWTNQISTCGGDPACIDHKRINVSAAFFLSIEFQETGYLVYRAYKAAYGNLSGAPIPIRLNEFLPDTQQIGQGVIVNQAGWQPLLENNQQSFFAGFVQRSRFSLALPARLTPDQFVDQLFMNAGVAPSSNDRAAAINEFGGMPNTADIAARARALRRVAENQTLAQQEFNRAFVLMQYFGYLRRNPNDPPEAALNFDGYDFWLNKLNRAHGDYIAAEMVKAFLLSTEYRQRFGPEGVIAIIPDDK